MVLSVMRPSQLEREREERERKSVQMGTLYSVSIVAVVGTQNFVKHNVKLQAPPNVGLMAAANGVVQCAVATRMMLLL